MKLENLVKALSFVVPLAIAYNVKPIGAQQTQQAQQAQPVQPQQQTQQTQQTQQRQCPSYVKEFWKSQEDYKNSIKRDVSGDVVIYTISNAAQLKLGMAIGDIIGEDLGSIVVIGYKAGGNEMTMRVEEGGQIITKKVKGAANALRIYALLNPDVYNCFVEPKAEEAKTQIAKPQEKTAKEEILPEQTLEQKIIKELEEEEKGEKEKTPKARKKEVKEKEKEVKAGAEEKEEEEGGLFIYPRRRFSFFGDYSSVGSSNAFVGVLGKNYTLLGEGGGGKILEEEKFKGHRESIFGDYFVSSLGLEISGGMYSLSGEKNEIEKTNQGMSLGIRKIFDDTYVGGHFFYFGKEGNDRSIETQQTSIELPEGGKDIYRIDIIRDNKYKKSGYSLLLEGGKRIRIDGNSFTIGGLFEYARIKEETRVNQVISTPDGSFTETIKDKWSGNVFRPGLRFGYEAENFGIEGILLGSVGEKKFISNPFVGSSLLGYVIIPYKNLVVITEKRIEGAIPLVVNVQSYDRYEDYGSYAGLRISLGINQNPTHWKRLNNSRVYLLNEFADILETYDKLTLSNLDGINGFGGKIDVEVGEGQKPIYGFGGTYGNEDRGIKVELEYKLDTKGRDGIGGRACKKLGSIDLCIGGEVKTDGDFSIDGGINVEF